MNTSIMCPLLGPLFQQPLSRVTLLHPAQLRLLSLPFLRPGAQADGFGHHLLPVFRRQRLDFFQHGFSLCAHGAKPARST